MVLARQVGGRKVVTVVPLHPELKPGTLLGVLELAGLTREEFIRAYEETARPGSCCIAATAGGKPARTAYYPDCAAIAIIEPETRASYAEPL